MIKIHLYGCLSTIAKKILYLCYFILCLLTKKENIIIFSSTPDVSDNSYFTYRYLGSRLRGFQVVWLIGKSSNLIAERINSIAKKNNLNVEVVKRRSIRALFLLSKAKVVFITHYLYKFIGSVPNGPIIINLWHGMPIKKIANDNQAKAPYCDFTIALSERYAKILMSSFGISREQVLTIGSPRTDFLMAGRQRNRTCIYEKLGVLRSKRIILWLPTFRKSKRIFLFGHEDSYNNSFLDEVEVGFLHQLDVIAHKNSLIILIKLHPLDCLNYQDNIPWGYENIRLVYENEWKKYDIDLYELIAYSEGVVSDISSVIVDCVYCHIKVAILELDRSRYRKELYYDPVVEFGLKKITSAEDLWEFIDEDSASLVDYKQTILGDSVYSSCVDYLYKRFIN